MSQQDDDHLYLLLREKMFWSTPGQRKHMNGVILTQRQRRLMILSSLSYAIDQSDCPEICLVVYQGLLERVHRNEQPVGYFHSGLSDIEAIQVRYLSLLAHTLHTLLSFFQRNTPKTHPELFFRGTVNGIMLTRKTDQKRMRLSQLDIIGNPFDPLPAIPQSTDPQVQAVAQAIVAEHRLQDLPILADALEDANCRNQRLLDHLRDTTIPHHLGCHGLDAALGLPPATTIWHCP